MNTNTINAWAVVNAKTKEIEALEFTREDARKTKRSLNTKGVQTKLAKMAFEKFAR